MIDTNKSAKNLYVLINEEEDARACRDIPEAACREQPHNYFAYLLANMFGKIADELASARLILPWLMASVGVPAALVGFIVPIREAGVLLPQLIVAAFIRRMPVRKGMWIVGAGISGLALALMALATSRLTGMVAGWVILLLLTVYSLARGLCSVSAKDVLGKTISKGRRGTLMGYSAGISAIVVLATGLYVEWSGAGADTTGLLIWLLNIAAVLWFLAIIFFTTIREQPGATEGGTSAIAVAFESVSIIFTDRVFRDFVIGRILLLSVALAPPFYVLLAQENSEDGMLGLGLLIIANGIAGSISAPFWGKLSDYSSRLVMVLAASAASIQGILLFMLVKMNTALLDSQWFYAGMFFFLTICHGGVRLGRKVYLVDMASADTRATYVALSNTLLGIAIRVSGAIGMLADIYSAQIVILLLAIASFMAAVWNWRLPDVS